MFNQEELAVKIAQVESQLQHQEMTVKLLREIRDELREQSVYHQMMEELRQLKRSLGDYHMEYADEFQILRESLEGMNWPLAVEPSVLAETEEAKETLAESIIQFVVTDYLKDLSFLDFGCGEGRVVTSAMKQKPTKSIGFDIIEDKWDRVELEENCLLTTDWNAVAENAPYDIVLLFDVLDHCENETPQEALYKIKNVLALDGKIVVKSHPWCSRHGAHLHKCGLNKAFAHLIFDDVELTRLGYQPPMIVLPVTHPLETYHDWFKDVNLGIESEYVTTSKPENFFHKKEIHDRIAKHYKYDDDFNKYLSVETVDFILKPKSPAIF